MIFVSYRREDSEDATARLHRGLVEHFGETRVFRDTAAIRPGDPFPARIRDALAACRVMLVVIGRSWLSVLLNDPADWVRLEIAEALKPGSGVTVIPVTVNGASLPPARHLPEPLQPLVSCNRVVLHADPDFDRAVEALAEEVAKRLGEPFEPKAVDTGFRIFLGTDADDPATSLLHRRLTTRLRGEPGITLLADIPPPRAVREHAAEARRLADQADLCVHLLGPGPGRPIEGAEAGRTYVLEQAAIALEQRRPMLVLQSRDFREDEIKHEGYRELLGRLRVCNDRRLERVQALPDELVRRVLEKKAELEERARAKAELTGGLTAVVDVHPSDVARAARLVEYLKKRDVTARVLRPGDSPSASPTELEDRFARALEGAQLFIVVYGEASYDWVRGRVKQATSVAIDDELGLKVAVCLEPPAVPREQQLKKTYPVRFINNLISFDSATVDELLGEARGAA